MKGKRVLSLALASISVMGLAATGCKKKVDSSSPEVLEIYVLSQGRGDEWLFTAAENFKNSAYVKEKYPNFKYDITKNADESFANNQILTGQTKYDVMTISGLVGKIVTTKGKNGEPSMLTNINDVYEGKIPNFDGKGYEKNPEGQDWTVAEKIKRADPLSYDVIGYTTWDDDGVESETNYYYLPNSSTTYGVIYNKTEMLEHGFLTQDSSGNIVGLPRTTDELLTFAKGIKTAGQVPFVSSMGTGYWMRIQNAWWSQYEGEEAFKRYFNAEYKNELGEWEQGIKVLDNQTRVLVNSITDSYINYKNGLIYEESAALSYTKSQATLLKGDALMMANGDWLDYEMRDVIAKADKKIELGMMPLPMISNIIEVVPDKSIANDAELSALLGAMNSGSTELSGTFDGVAYEVTQADFDRIKEANSIFPLGEGVGAWGIPSYSPAKEVAKDFLRYMATDEFCKTYMTATWGASRMMYYDVETKDPELYTQLSSLQKDRLQFVKGRHGTYPYKASYNPLICNTNYIYFIEGFEDAHMAQADSANMTAAQAIKKQISNYKKDDGTGNENWNSMMRNAGIVVGSAN